MGIFGIVILSLIINFSVKAAEIAKMPKFAEFSTQLGRTSWMSLDLHGSFTSPAQPVLDQDHSITIGGKVLQPILGVTGVV
jgi:hypothetical protein